MTETSVMLFSYKGFSYAVFRMWKPFPVKNTRTFNCHFASVLTYKAVLKQELYSLQGSIMEVCWHNWRSEWIRLNKLGGRIQRNARCWNIEAVVRTLLSTVLCWYNLDALDWLTVSLVQNLSVQVHEKVLESCRT